MSTPRRSIDVRVERLQIVNDLESLATTHEGCDTFIANCLTHKLSEHLVLNRLAQMKDQNAVHRFGLRLWGHQTWCDKFERVKRRRQNVFGNFAPVHLGDPIVRLGLDIRITIAVRSVRLVLDEIPSYHAIPDTNYRLQQLWAARMKLALSFLADTKDNNRDIRDAAEQIQVMPDLVSYTLAAHVA